MPGFVLNGKSVSEADSVAIAGSQVAGIAFGGTVIYQPQVQAGPLSFITSVTPGATRNAYQGLVGMQITVGSSPLVLEALGRWILAGNNGSVAINLYSSNGTGLRFGSINLSTATPNRFAYASVAPITLTPVTTYRILFDSDSANDWADGSWNLSCRSSDASFVVAWLRGSDSSYFTGGADLAYGPVDFLYTK